jgi:hypothetical protein
MKFTEFCDVINKQIELIYYPNQNNRWSAKLVRGETMENNLLRGHFGDGSSPDEAIRNYIEGIKGTRIAFNAMTDKRVEFVVPQNLEY